MRKILLYEKSDQTSKQNLFSQIQIGNEIQVTGEAESFEQAGNPGQFDARSYYEAVQVDARVFVSHIQILNVSYNPVKQLLYEWRTKAMQQLTAAMGERDAGLLGAMILGDKAQLDSEVRNCTSRPEWLICSLYPDCIFLFWGWFCLTGYANTFSR